MFTRGLRGRGMGRLGEFINEPRKVEYWLPNTFGPQASIIPGVSNTTAAVAAGGTAAAAIAALAAWWFLKK
jgi:hypothetical protein